MEFPVFAALMFFAFIATEGAVEYLVGPLFEKFAPNFKWMQMYISAAAGIGLAFGYGLDLPALWFGVQESIVGIVITGIVMGRGANAVHDIAQLASGWARSRFE